MLTLDTDFYNYRLASIHQQADLASDLCDFINVLNQLSRSDFPMVSNELEQGSLSIASVAAALIRGIRACIQWALNIISKVVKFLIKGYQPGFKRCYKLIEQISPKLPTLQKYGYNYIVTLKSMTDGKNIIDHHLNKSTIPGFGQNVPSNIIAQIRKQYVAEFNKLQSKQGQINMNFAMTNAPGVSSGKLKDFGIHGKNDLDAIVEQFEEIKNTLSEKLENLKSDQGYKIRQVMMKLQNKTYADKFVKNKVNVTETLIAVFEAAIVGQDTKWFKTMQNHFIKELTWFAKKAGNIVASGDTSPENPEATHHETF